MASEVVALDWKPVFGFLAAFIALVLPVWFAWPCRRGIAVWIATNWNQLLAC
jgi:hypothetical protein